MTHKLFKLISGVVVITLMWQPVGWSSIHCLRQRSAVDRQELPAAGRAIVDKIKSFNRERLTLTTPEGLRQTMTEDVIARAQILSEVLSDPICANNLGVTHRALTDYCRVNEVSRDSPDAWLLLLIPLVPTELVVLKSFPCYTVNEHDAILGIMQMLGIEGAYGINFDRHDDKNGFRPEGKWGRYAIQQNHFARYDVINSDVECLESSLREKIIARVRTAKQGVVATICYDYFSIDKELRIVEEEVAHIRDFLVELVHESGVPILLAVSAQSKLWVLYELELMYQGTEDPERLREQTNELTTYLDTQLPKMFEEVSRAIETMDKKRTWNSRIVNSILRFQI